MTFSNVGTIRQKAIARTCNHTDLSNSKTEWRTRLPNHGLNGISLRTVDFELPVFKKMLLVALGIWLSIFYPRHEKTCLRMCATDQTDLQRLAGVLTFWIYHV